MGRVAFDRISCGAELGSRLVRRRSLVAFRAALASVPSRAAMDGISCCAGLRLHFIAYCYLECLSVFFLAPDVLEPHL